MTSRSNPPRFFLRFFRWFCHPKLRNYIEGDLVEVYNEQLETSGKRVADIKFIIDVLLLFRPGIIKPVKTHESLNNYAMVKSYFKIGWRNLLRNKGYSLINIGGLAAGMAVAMLIGIWDYDELSFDKYHHNFDRVAKVFQHVTNNGEIQTIPVVPYPLAAELRKNYGDDFKEVVLAKEGEWRMLAVGDEKITAPGTFFEPGAIKMLGLKMIYGNSDCLRDLSSIALSQSLAKKFFGETNPLNQLIKIDNTWDVKVAGVYEDLPHNSSFNGVLFMAPWDQFFKNTEWVRTANDPWRPNAFQIYVQLGENADAEKVSLKIRDAKLKNVNSELAKKKPALFLHPMSKWHLFSEFKNGFNTGGRIQYVWLFSTIGIFVLLLACINFMNLSTARSEKRAKEVGIRKAIGSQRGSLIRQFFCEALLVASFAFIASLLFVQLMIPYFNDIADKKMSIPWSTPLFWFAGIGFSILTGFVAGIYPAFYLSSFQPLKVLKGTFRMGSAGVIPRRVLLLVQFTVSVALVIGTIIVFRQIQFAQSRPVGYDTNGLVVLPQVTGDIHAHFDAVKNELTKSGAIVGMAEATNPTTEFWSTTSGFDWRDKDPNFSTDVPNVGISYDYGKVIGWQIKDGRDFSAEFASDSSGIIINETMAQFIALENPVGETLNWFKEPFTIIGVVNDMIVQSPYQPTKPTAYYLSRSTENFVIAKMNPTISANEALEKIQLTFKKFNPSSPVDYTFADDEYAKKFDTEVRIGKLATFFAVLAIFISCLGVYGMASFTAEQRTKEIGVRKVLGASVFNVWKMLSKDFVFLVLISQFIAFPIAYYGMKNWIEKYEYHTDFAWWIFAATGTGALLITLLTVSIQSVKSALMNPVRSLRSE